MSKFPSPAYLLGSMIEDAVPRELAVKVAHGYADARQAMSDEQTHKWLNAMIANLGPMSAYPNTAIAVLAQPSPHRIDHYNTLAVAAGWKE